MPSGYIVLCHSGTLPSNVVRFFTRRPYSHACYAPDEALSLLHTFGRLHTRFFIPGGYISGGVNSEFYTVHPHTKMRVLRMELSEEQLARINARLAPFEAEPRRYKYGFINCLYQLFGIRRQRPRHFTCSQFVGLLLQDILPMHRPPSLMRPMDFCEMGLTCVFEGTAEEYRRRMSARTTA